MSTARSGIAVPRYTVCAASPLFPALRNFFPSPSVRIGESTTPLFSSTNVHRLLACSRVCHRENGPSEPSNRKRAPFFPPILVVIVVGSAHMGDAQRVPQIGPFFRPMSDVASRAELFPRRCSGYAQITGSLFANDRSFSLSLSIFSKVDRANNEHCVRCCSVSTKRLEGSC